MPDKTRVRAIIQKNKKYLLVKSAEEHNYGKWQFVGGNVESKDLLNEIKREVREELGADLINIRYAFPVYGRRGKVHYFTGNLKGKIKIDSNEIADYGYFDCKSAKKLSLSNTARLTLKKLCQKSRNP